MPIEIPIEITIFSSGVVALIQLVFSILGVIATASIALIAVWPMWQAWPKTQKIVAYVERDLWDEWFIVVRNLGPKDIYDLSAKIPSDLRWLAELGPSASFKWENVDFDESNHFFGDSFVKKGAEARLYIGSVVSRQLTVSNDLTQNQVEMLDFEFRPGSGNLRKQSVDVSFAPLHRYLKLREFSIKTDIDLPGGPEAT